jgi:hypothetical protein
MYPPRRRENDRKDHLCGSCKDGVQTAGRGTMPHDRLRVTAVQAIDLAGAAYTPGVYLIYRGGDTVSWSLPTSCHSGRYVLDGRVLTVIAGAPLPPGNPRRAHAAVPGCCDIGIRLGYGR